MDKMQQAKTRKIRRINFEDLTRTFAINVELAPFTHHSMCSLPFLHHIPQHQMVLHPCLCHSSVAGFPYFCHVHLMRSLTWRIQSSTLKPINSGYLSISLRSHLYLSEAQEICFLLKFRYQHMQKVLVGSCGVEDLLAYCIVTIEYIQQLLLLIQSISSCP